MSQTDAEVARQIVEETLPCMWGCRFVDKHLVTCPSVHRDRVAAAIERALGEQRERLEDDFKFTSHACIHCGKSG